MGYEFQDTLIQQVLATFKTYDKCILAACTGGGKTNMAIEISKNFKKVLVLAHGQSILRTQFHSRAIAKGFDSFLLDPTNKQKFKEIPQHHMVVTLPQTIKKSYFPPNYFDLIIIDEAHEWYKAETVTKICEIQSTAKQLLLSASPFTLRSVEPRIPEVSFVATDAIEHDVCSNVAINIVTSSNARIFNFDNMTDSFEIREDVNMADEDVKSSVWQMLDALCSESAWKTSNKLIRFVANNFQFIRNRIKQLGKTVFVASNIPMADLISSYLSEQGISHLVSHSSIDPDSEKIEAFKSGQSNILVVVNRARLGFDMPTLENIIDMSGSLNPSTIYQQVGRVMRKHDKVKNKKFLKLCPPAYLEIYRASMRIVGAIMVRSWYEAFNPSDYKRMRIPVAHPIENDENGDDGNENNLLQERSVGERVDNPPESKMYLMDFAETVPLFQQISYDEAQVLSVCASETLVGIKAKLTNSNVNPENYKRQLIYLASIGAERPHHSTILGTALARYTNKTKTYDENFHKQIINLSPKWFKNSNKNASKSILTSQEKKQLILDMIINGKQKPSDKSVLNNAFKRYLSKSNKSYDEDFEKAVIEADIEKSWLPYQRPNIIKQQLIRMAESGQERPKRTEKLGSLLCAYIDPSKRSYDVDFEIKIVSIAKEKWFYSSKIKRVNDLIQKAQSQDLDISK